jgi:hypothetical protein
MRYHFDRTFELKTFPFSKRYRVYPVPFKVEPFRKRTRAIFWDHTPPKP